MFRLLPLRSLRQGGVFSKLETSLKHSNNDSLHASVSMPNLLLSRGLHSDSNASAASSAANVDGAAAAAATTTGSPSPSPSASASDTLSVGACVAAFRSRGHLLARLDPLGRGADGVSGRGVWLGEEQARGTTACSRARAWEDQRLARLLAAVDREEREGQYDDEELARAACEALGLSAGAAGATFDLGAPLLLAPEERAGGGRHRPHPPPPPSSPLVGGPPLNRQHWRLAPLVRSLASAYCGTLALEVDHLSPEKAAWLVRERERLLLLESSPGPPRRAQRRATLRLLARAAAFEAFLASRFPTSKRFGLEGLDALAPGLLAAADELSSLGVRRLAVGTPHRGRLSLLAAVLRTPAGQIFAEMEAAQSEWHVGDVKYHLGKGATLEFSDDDDDNGEEGEKGATTKGPKTKKKQPPPRSLHVSVAPNPSHLESVGPVVLGMVRAQQASFPGGSAAVAPLLVHGDASFAGLGVVFETLQMADVPGYGVGGTVHLVANNQCGFTTPPSSARTSPHPTAAALAAGAAVLHACADDPDAVVAGARLAARWRAQFGCDAALDVVGYRRHGHNELDDPESSAPLTTRAIAAQEPVLKKYAAALERDGDAAPGEAAAWLAAATRELEAEFAAFRRGDYAQSADDWLRGSWQGDALAALASSAPPALLLADDEGGGTAGREKLKQRSEPTGLPVETLRWVGRAITTPPRGFTPTPQAAAVLAARRACFDGGEDARVDFATAEALAFGSLALKRRGGKRGGGVSGGSRRHSRNNGNGNDGNNGSNGDPAAAAAGLNVGSYAVRLSGQDVERGTFNQRHAVLRDAGTGRRCVLLDEMEQEEEQKEEEPSSSPPPPLREVKRPGVVRPPPRRASPARQRQERVEVWNSPLNEGATLAFEYGFSLGAAGRALVLWEAQFGDFANNAQAVVDLFVAAAEERWNQQSGLVLLLPHGFDGQGPDHSSARIERFLQLCNDDGDALPGESARERAEVAAAWAALSSKTNGGGPGGGIDRKRASQLLESLGMPGDAGAELLFEAVGGGRRGRRAAEEEEGKPLALLDEASWSAAMRRYLRRHAEARANLFVVSPTTPAQLFHALRGQLNRPFAKPLVVAAPKRLHFHKPATSALADLGAGSTWHRVIADGDELSDNTRHRARHPATGEALMVPDDQVRRVLLCSGQIYYALSAARRARKVRDVALVRVEQLSPFPYDDVAAAVGRHPNAEVVWAQEEPKNQGAWRFVQSRANTALRELLNSGDNGNGRGSASSSSSSSRPTPPRTLRFIGRPPSGTTATASLAIHREELRAIIDAALATELKQTGAEGLER